MRTLLSVSLVVTAFLLVPARAAAQVPVVYSFLPAPQATGAARGGSLQFVFSNDMSAQTASPAAISVRGSLTGTRTLAGGGSFNGGGTKIISFNPDKDFLPGEQVWVSVGATAQSTQGTAIAKPLVYSFLAKTKTAQAQFTHGYQMPNVVNILGVADFDGDGDIDLLSQVHTATQYDVTVLQRNNGQGEFPVVDTVPIQPRQYYAPLIIDVDGDGDIDAVLSPSLTLLNDGTGTFQVLSAPAPGSVDIDADGDLDFITTQFTTSAIIQVLRNDGNGQSTLLDQIVLPAGYSLDHPMDVDGDKDVDFTLMGGVINGTAANPNSLYTLLNDGYGHYTLRRQSNADYTYHHNRSDDLDGDGDQDILTGAYPILNDPNDGRELLVVRTNDGKGNFTTTQILNEVQTQYSTFNQYELADLDGDGDLDAVALYLHNGPTYLEAWLNDGAGHFTLGQTLYPNGDLPYYPFFIADIDGDGDMDIATTDDILLNANAPTVCQADGSILREYWADVPGSNIQNIPLSTTPTFTEQLTVFRTRANTADNYGQRIRGYLCPPATGNYTFFLQGDDNAELYLSIDGNPANKQLIASARIAWEWTRNISQQSPLISLVAGQSYYVEALHKEGSGGDVVRVGWRTPQMTANADPIIIPGSVLSPFVPLPARQAISTEEILPLTLLQVYPNPSSGTTTVEFTAQESGWLSLQLYNGQGQPLRQIFAEEVEVGSTRQRTLEGGFLADGLYMLRLVNGQHNATRKLVIVR
jgi:hypothetical protein